MSKRRIQKELDWLIKNPPVNYSTAPIGNDLFHWTATMIPPEESYYKGGKFNLDIKFPTDYPFKPMGIKFTTKIYHPNIHREGYLCNDLFDDSWSPSKTLKDCLNCIYLLFTSVNEYDVFDTKQELIYRFKPLLYIINVEEWVKKYVS